MKEYTIKDSIRFVGLAALFLVPLTPLLVADGFFFPFITGKAFFFRILVEVAVGAWVALAVLDREYRPRLSWIGIVLLAFLGWMFLADAFAINATKAFWSNFERMEGWVWLLHLTGFFFAMSAMLRVEKKWRGWFFTSLAVSLVISLYALLQIAGVLAIHQGSTRIDATLGNSAYLAIYFLFSLCVALWLALSEKRNWLRVSLIVLAVLEGVLLFFTETRGTIIGLVLGFAVAALLTLLTAGKSARRGAAAALVLLFLAVGGFALVRDSAVVQENHVLQRVASISLADGQTRFTIWHIAYQGVLENPVLGWGQEGFNYVFSKYFDPSLYKQEPWFDRAHNAFVDWSIAGGVPALLLYIALFGSTLVLLYRSSELSRAERIALTAALVGYAVHNLFVFDNLSSYIYFFALLALVDSQVGRSVARLDSLPEATGEQVHTIVLPITVAVVLVAIWTVNVSGMRVASGLITALSPSTKGVEASLAAFEELAENPSFAAQEIREQLVSAESNFMQSTNVTDEQKQRIASLAISEMRKQVAAYPLDVREHIQLAYAYRAVGDATSTLAALGEAVRLSPRKQDTWIQLGAALWDAGDVANAQKAFAQAYALGPQFPELAVYAAAGSVAAGDRAAANTILKNTHGTTTVDSDVLAVAYYRTKQWDGLISIWKLRVAAPTATAQTWFGLAASYYAAGDTTNAIRVVKEAMQKYPEAVASGEAAIKQIEGTR